MRIGLSTAAYYGRLETEDAAARIAALGIACCEVFLETYSEYTSAFGALVRGRLGGTDALSIHSKTQHFEADFLGASARQREDAYGMLEGFLDAGRALGAGIYVYHGPANVRSTSPAYERWQAAIDRVIDACLSRDIALCWEAVSWCHLNHPDKVRAFRDIWPRLGFVLDIKQVYELGHDPLDYVAAMGERLRHVHVLDWDAQGRYVLPGQGVFDFARLARALRGVGYAGDVILEPYGSMAMTDGDILRSIDHLCRVFDAV